MTRKQLLTNIFMFILSSTMGLLFIYSGYSKLEPIEPFEFTFVDLGIGGWRSAPFIARFMIGLEFFIGLLLIFGLFIKRITIKLTAVSLLIFCLYLVFVIINTGDNGNCGCFGNKISMTPSEALIKNGITLISCFFLYKYYNGLNYGKFSKWLFGTLFISAFALPHILNYIDLDYSSAYLTKKEDHFKLELDSLYKDAKKNIPPTTLSKGKHIIAFMSMSCPHCRIAAKKLRIMHEKNQTISMYLVLNGEDNKIKPFFEDTKATNIDYCILNGKNFIYLAGLDMPAIYMVNNSVVENWVDYMQLDQTKIEEWMAN
jgi:uncharacterized membrane protein YphA (DoxX/SURF4 family)